MQCQVTVGSDNVFWPKVTKYSAKSSYSMIGECIFGLKWLKVALHQVRVWLGMFIMPKWLKVKLTYGILEELSFMLFWLHYTTALFGIMARL